MTPPTITSERTRAIPHRRRTILRVVAALAAILATLVSGARPQQITTDKPSGTPIRVGLYTDLTGQTSSFGFATRNGVNLAVEEINRAGGIDGRPIELVVRDDQGIPSNASRTAQELIDGEHVVALIGEVASTNSLAAAPRAQAAKIPMISPSSTNPKVTQVGDYIFRAAFVDPQQGTAMAQFARNELHAKTAAIFADVNSDYSKSSAAYFKDEITQTGGQMVSEMGYVQGDLNFRGQLREIQRARPDVIYVPGYYSQAGLIIKQARQLGIQQPILGGDGWDAPELFKLGGNALRNTYMSNHYATDDPSPVVHKFISRYQSRFGERPDALAALGYDAVNLLADALRRAGSTEGPKLRNALAETKNFHGVTGDITFDAERVPSKPVVVLEYRGNRYVYRDKFVPRVFHRLKSDPLELPRQYPERSVTPVANLTVKP